jgi:hypothetical protein
MFNFCHVHTVTKSAYHHVRLSVHMHQHGSHLVDFCKNLILRESIKIYPENPNLVKIRLQDQALYVLLPLETIKCSKSAPIK